MKKIRNKIIAKFNKSIVSDLEEWRDLCATICTYYAWITIEEFNNIIDVLKDEKLIDEKYVKQYLIDIAYNNDDL